MSTAVKEKILTVLKKDKPKYIEIVEFFLDPDISNSEKELKSNHILKHEIQNIDKDNLDMPNDFELLVKWIRQKNESQCVQYKEYLDRRSEGGNREYFSNLIAAYEFLYKVAPTKKVDGSWLFSFTQYWNDPVFRDFIQIYLEELGMGSEKSNHVKMYENLLIAHGLDRLSINLPDIYYHQAAVQLALAYAPPEFIPEIAGFNLGYEQLPLHLLITNYELKELGIDSQYFNVHITIDNFDNGHAQLATNAIKKLSNQYKSKEEFFRKLRVGYLLNDVGISSREIIKNLNNEKMVIEILKNKAIVGKHMHNNKCKFGNYTTNEWLSEDQKVEKFVSELISLGWIKLNESPDQSKFWRMIHDEDGRMYGVFNIIEQKFIFDWIAGNSLDQKSNMFSKSKVKEFVELNSFSYLPNHALAALEDEIGSSINTSYKINKLMKYLSPHSHHQEIGLWSTKKVTGYLFPTLI